MSSMFGKITRCNRKCIIWILVLAVSFSLLIYYKFKISKVKFSEIHSKQCEKLYTNNWINGSNWQKHILVPPRCQNRILIISQHRSGSSFFGDLLQQSWSTYYLYEPLYILGETVYIDQIKNKKKVQEAFDTLVKIFNCKCLNETRYNRKIYWALHWTKAMKGFMNETDKLANSEQVCERCQNLLIKSVRINIQFVVKLSNKLKSFRNTLKIVMLVRDPRAILNSRLNPSLGFCFGGCRDPALICQQIRSNLESLTMLKKQSSHLLDDLTIVRYEDLSLNTKSMAKKLYQRLGLNFSPNVEEWIQMKTKQKRNNLKTPSRNTTENVISWTKTFKDWKMDLNSVQNQCSDVMQILGYKTITLHELNQAKNIMPAHLISKQFKLKNKFKKNFI